MNVQPEVIAEAAREFNNSPKTGGTLSDFLGRYPLEELSAAVVSPELDVRQRENVILAMSTVLDDEQLGVPIVNSEAGRALIVSGLSAPLEEVRSLAARQLVKLNRASLEAQPSLFAVALAALDDEEVTVVSRVQAGLASFAKVGDDVLQRGFGGRYPDIAEKLLQGKGEQGQVSLVRYAEASLAMAEFSPVVRQELSSVLWYVADGLVGNDILLKMNLIELFTRAAELMGSAWLESHFQVLAKLSAILDDILEDPSSPDVRILAEGVVKFVESVAYKSAAVDLEALFRFIPTMTQLLQNSPIQERAVAATASFGSSAAGIHMLLSRSPEAVSSSVKLCLSPKAELKVAALFSLGAMLDSSPNDEESRQIFRVLESKMGVRETVADWLTTLIARPFPEVQLAAIRVFRSLCRRSWGLRNVSSAPNFTSALITIRDDPAEVTNAKVTLAGEIVTDPEARSFFGDTEYANISALARSKVTGLAPRREAQVDIATQQL